MTVANFFCGPLDVQGTKSSTYTRFGVALSGNTTLTELDVGMNNLRHTTVPKSIAQAIANPASVLQNVNMSTCRLSADDQLSLVNALRGNRTMKHLWLCKNYCLSPEQHAQLCALSNEVSLVNANTKTEEISETTTMCHISLTSAAECRQFGVTDEARREKFHQQYLRNQREHCLGEDDNLSINVVNVKSRLDDDPLRIDDQLGSGNISDIQDAVQQEYGIDPEKQIFVYRGKRCDKKQAWYTYREEILKGDVLTIFVIQKLTPAEREQFKNNKHT